MTRKAIIDRWEFAQRWLIELAAFYGKESVEVEEWVCGEYAEAFEARRKVK